MEKESERRKKIREAGRARRAVLRENERFTWHADDLVFEEESSSSSKGRSKSTTG